MICWSFESLERPFPRPAATHCQRAGGGISGAVGLRHGGVFLEWFATKTMSLILERSGNTCAWQAAGRSMKSTLTSLDSAFAGRRYSIFIRTR